MQDKPVWYYDEFKQIGTDYNSVEEVRLYDQRMHMLRNIPREVADTIDQLDLRPDSILLEIGCGTCELSISAAQVCRTVYAVDISEVMLEYASAKADSRGVGNVEFHRGGFLSYEHDGKPVDVVVTQLALHHLPDFWKLIALGRIRDILKPGGMLFLRDVVFSFEPEDYRKVLDAWVEAVADAGGSQNAVNCANHIRDEYSTLSWAMEEMLCRAGFNIVQADYTDGVFAVYKCRKP